MCFRPNPKYNPIKKSRGSRLKKLSFIYFYSLHGQNYWHFKTIYTTYCICCIQAADGFGETTTSCSAAIRLAWADWPAGSSLLLAFAAAANLVTMLPIAIHSWVNCGENFSVSTRFRSIVWVEMYRNSVYTLKFPPLGPSPKRALSSKRPPGFRILMSSSPCLKV
jgi:hypothetical protein